MNIIINASNLRVGGALQVALSTIEELHRFPQHIFHVFLSPAFEGLIDYDMSEKSNINFYSVEFPSRFTILGNVKQLDNLEMKIGADCVFSIFGPTYWKPKSPHLAGFAQGYYLYRNLPFFDTIGLFEKVKLFLLSSYHGFLLKKHVDEFVVETYDVKSRLMSFLNINESSIHVATNTYSTYFKDFNKGLFVRGEPAGDTKIFRLLTIAYPYPHKNLEILKKVSDILNKDTIGFHFNITVPDKYYQEVFNGYEDTIINLGPIKNRDCPKIYQQCHAMILPTLVECFSASYPEAMKMERPILTSNYPFASTVCKNAALYFNAHDPSDIADKIRTLAGDPDLYTSLVAAGNERLSAFLSPTERCSKYINLLYKLRDR